MPQPVHNEPNLANPPTRGLGAGQPPQSGQNQPSQGESRFVDGSDPLFHMYLEMAGEEDKKMADSWKADAKGILIFTGLFSAALAALITVSVQDLKANSQDISAFYLAKMYQLSADSNGSQVLIPSTLRDPSVPFSPPKSAVLVNSLWFLSLVISLTCALLATLLQQWSRRYLKVTQTRYSLHKRARIRAFFAEGVDKLHLPWAVEALPALLHLSLFLFFAGLAVFLFNINYTVFKVAVSWICVCTGIYICITFMPMFRHDSPYYTPLSSSPWYLCNGTLSAVCRIFSWIALLLQCYSTYDCILTLSEMYQKRILQGIEKEFQETARKRPPEIDGRALVRTFESLDEDQELERFFTGILGFCSSNVVIDPQSRLAQLDRWQMDQALTGFLRRSLSSNLLSEPIKEWRFVICVKVIDIVQLPDAAPYILVDLFAQHTLVRSIEIGHSLITRGDNSDREIAPCAQGIIAYIIANAPQRENHWFSLAMYHLDKSEHDLRVYLAHGDSVLLANLIHITRQLFRGFLRADSRVALAVAYSILPRVLNLRVQETLPELQHDFCQLWNEIVREARSNNDSAFYILKFLQLIRVIYLALHQTAPITFSTSNPDGHDNLNQVSSYHLCNIPSHRLDPASHLNEVDDSKTPPIATCDGPRSPTSCLDATKPQPAPDTQQRISPAAPSSYPTPPENDRFPNDALAGSVQDTAGPSLGSFTANFDFQSTLGGDAASPGIGSATITARPTFNPDAVPDRAPHGGLISPPSIQIAASSLSAPRNLDSNAMTNLEIGSHDSPGDTRDPNCRQSFISSSPNIAEDNPRPKDSDPSENV